ncbi:hypothetical protein QQ045_020878 [Rhodiola kirilowii]
MSEEKKTKHKPERRQVITMPHSSSSSSIRRESPPKTCNSTTFGCMSGIFRLFSNHYSARRKFLTFGKKKEIRSSNETESQQQSRSTEIDRRFSIESPRSPTLPQAIRGQSSSVAAEKRMLLLGALAKCDEDLRELRKIIEELKSHSSAVDREDVVKPAMMPPKVRDDLVTEISSGEQPSPVSVLDELTRSPPSSRCARRSLQYGSCLQQQQIRKRHEEEFLFLGDLHLKSIQRAAHHGNNLGSSSLWCSRAMVETVEKACSEIAWGEKREQGRIGMALQDQIYRDLIEEIVKDIMEISYMHRGQRMKLSYTENKLQSRGCRRRLSY